LNRAGAILGLAAAVLAGCAAPTGDFGRPRPNVINDEILPKAGMIAASLREEPVSRFRLNDAEIELRNRAYVFLMPASERAFVERQFAEWRRQRLIRPGALRFGREAYVRDLLGVRYRSSSARFAKLDTDIRADGMRIDPFVDAAAEVARLDRVRLESLQRIPDITPSERAQAHARVDENAMVIGWVHGALEERAIAYRYALERLIIETPDDRAIEAESALIVFEAHLAELRGYAPPNGAYAGGPVYGK
jgi:hypothetical protein